MKFTLLELVEQTLQHRVSASG